MKDMSLRNLTAFERPLTMRVYRDAAALQAPEAVILERLRVEFAGKRILDIGVGRGRTTQHLLNISSSYVGVDYSSKMIASCRKRFPSVDFQVCDARDLSAFSDGSFDLVMFSFNGLDLVNPVDRLKVLAEVRRVLAGDGAFVFSSHNRNCPLRGPWSLSNLPLRINPFAKPLHFAHKLLTYPLGIVNYYKNLRYQEHTEEYALVIDEAHEFGVIHYYISADSQVRQLERASFKAVEVVSLDGRLLQPSDHQSRRDPWLYYVCRR